MSDTVVFDGELSLEIPLDGECQAVYQVGTEPVINALTATENGTYTAENGVDGFSPVTVNVSPDVEALTVTENGTYTAPGDGYNPVVVAVPEPTHNTETWTFTLNDDSTVEKVVIIDE